MKHRIRMAKVFKNAARKIETGENHYSCTAVLAALDELLRRRGVFFSRMTDQAINERQKVIDLLGTFGVGYETAPVEIADTFGDWSGDNARSFRHAWLKLLEQYAQETNLRIFVRD